jgi:hypothetical protein
VNIVFAQFHDNITLLGFYGGFLSPPGDIRGITQLSFPDGKLQVEENTELAMYFDGANASYSDSSGNLRLL